MTKEIKAQVVLSETISFLAKKAGITDQDFVALLANKDPKAMDAFATVAAWGVQALAEEGKLSAG